MIEGLLMAAAKRRAGGFSPLNIPGCVAWYDASDASTLYDAFPSGGSLVAANGSVARWQDKSSNAKDLGQTAAGSQPTRRVAVQNGLDAIEFDGSADFMQSSFGTTSQHWFVVAIYTNATFGEFNGLIHGPTNTGADRILRGNGAGSTIFQADVGSRRKDGATSDNGPMAAWAQHTAEYATGWNTNGTLNVGRRQTAAGYWLGHIGEIIGYSTVLSSTDRDAVEAYLKAKWGTP